MARTDASASPKRAKGAKSERRVGRTVGHIILTLVVTIVMVLALCAGLLAVVFLGPSPTMRNVTTLSFAETSAIYWIPRIFLPQSQVEAILSAKEVDQTDVTDADLIHIDAGKVSDAGDSESEGDGDPVVSPNQEDPDGDGITVEEVRGPTYRGFMMIVYDPSRVILGVPDAYGDSASGLDLWEMVEKYDATAAINAGGFYDPDGSGTGGIPDGLVIYEGDLRWGDAGTSYSIVGFDADYKLHAGTMSGQEALDVGIQYACTFGPALVVNGTPQNENGPLESGVNPRTAIGQRADGAVLLLVLDGRQVQSLGATYDDLVSIMLDYGAMNASNLDGGSSSMMIWNDTLLNTCASVVGPRDLATSFVVLPN